ncbi:hypothetical protein Pmani_029057 [Petrolisthes manimaculis]|uniref:Uncharacterized protein n=1 Tax=Petrolisthes manimaculis TaxID=1843537 RepID=A0AAE1P029_9EUCA|nr:hypothetical protein Pmani_029057 [Petrolisthes manimaculis]
MCTQVARSLTSRVCHQFHPSSSPTFLTLPNQSTSTQGEALCERRDAQVDFPVTLRHSIEKKRSRSNNIPPSSIIITEYVPTPAVPGTSTSRHASTPRSHPRQRIL